MIGVITLLMTPSMNLAMVMVSFIVAIFPVVIFIVTILLVSLISMMLGMVSIRMKIKGNPDLRGLMMADFAMALLPIAGLGRQHHSDGT